MWERMKDSGQSFVQKKNICPNVTEQVLFNSAELAAEQKIEQFEKTSKTEI